MEQLLQIKTMVSGFESFLPNLLNYLQNLCNTFKAGQVAAHFAAWRTLTSTVAQKGQTQIKKKTQIKKRKRK